MGWITTLIQLIPTIMAVITQLGPLIQAIINAINHKAASGSFMAASNPDWWIYCPGQALAGTAGAALILCLQPRMNAMARAYREIKEAEDAATEMILANRNQTAKAFRLKASLAALSPEHQQIVTK